MGRGGKCRPPRFISFHFALSLGPTQQAHTHMHTVHKCIYIHRKSITVSLTSTWILSCTGAGIQNGRGRETSDLKTEREREQEREGERE